MTTADDIRTSTGAIGNDPFARGAARCSLPGSG